MDYVIFDLEWNQCPYGKGKENPKLPFEIIEIGAVKMDGERNVVGTFHRIVKPVVYQHLHHRTREVVGLTEEDLQNGIPFAQAVQEFFAFSGGACMFGTWGPGDLTELQREASRRFDYSAKETLNIMQRLYENHKVLTYPRTDSRYLSSDIVPTLKERLKACSVGPYRVLAGRLINLQSPPLWMIRRYRTITPSSPQSSLWT